MSLKPGTKRNKAVVALSIAVGVLFSAGVALATPGLNFTLTPLARGTVAERIKVHTDEVKLQTKGPIDIFVNQLTIQPGGHTGWHSHPGPNLVVVKQGTVVSYDANCAARTLTAGQAFVDPGEGHVHIMRNVGTVPAVLLVTALMPVGAQLRIDEPAPATCF